MSRKSTSRKSIKKEDETEVRRTSLFPSSDDRFLHVRHCMLYEFNRRSNATSAARRICAVYPNSVAPSTCRRWFRRFRSGDLDISVKRPKRKANRSRSKSRGPRRSRKQSNRFDLRIAKRTSGPSGSENTDGEEDENRSESSEDDSVEEVVKTQVDEPSPISDAKLIPPRIKLLDLRVVIERCDHLIRGEFYASRNYVVPG